MNNQQPKLCFQNNLKYFLRAKNFTQKEFSLLSGVTESTLSGYIRGDKLPNIGFLSNLKPHLSDISIDDFLFTPLKEEDFLSDSSTVKDLSPVDLYKYYGDYYLYYLDTTKRMARQNPTLSAAALKYGILYIYKSYQSDTSAHCIAVFGIKKRTEAHHIKELIKSETLNPHSMIDKLKQHGVHNIYQGKLDLTSHHVFITLKQQTDKQDEAHIVLHHQDINNDFYCGGLGTASSASTGRLSDPIVQFIALSREQVYLSPIDIQSFLRFSNPIIDVNQFSETKKILELASLLNEESKENNYSSFSSEQKQILFIAYLNELVKKILESNHLWYGRVSLEDDDAWYHTVKNATEHTLKKLEKANE